MLISLYCNILISHQCRFLNQTGKCYKVNNLEMQVFTSFQLYSFETGQRSAGQVYRQPANQMIITTGTQQSYPNQYPPQQPYTQYPTAQNQYPYQGYVQHPPPVQGGYSPVQQAPPMTGSGYPPQESKAAPSGMCSVGKGSRVGFFFKVKILICIYIVFSPPA